MCPNGNRHCAVLGEWLLCQEQVLSALAGMEIQEVKDVDYVLALQVFNKPDMTSQLLTSIAQSRLPNDCHVVVLQDSLEGARNAAGYAQDHAKTKAVVEAWISAEKGRFTSADFYENPHNMGTCATTRRVIDLGAERSKNIFFSEDDTVFEVDAFDWFSHMLTHDAFLSPEVWAITGESKIFDSAGAKISDAQIAEGRVDVVDHDLMSKFYRLNFMPSTCFATTREKWAEFGETRGHPNGDRDVNTRCKEEGRYSLWPVVARVSDNGMHHPNGFSMLVHKTTDRIPNKTQHLTSGAFGAAKISEFTEMKQDFGALFQKYFQDWRNG